MNARREKRELKYFQRLKKIVNVGIQKRNKFHYFVKETRRKNGDMDDT